MLPNIPGKKSNYSLCYRCFTLFHNIVLKLSGVSPWTLNTSQLFRKNCAFDNRSLCTTSHIGSVYNMLIIIIILVLNYYSFFDKIYSSYFYQSKVGIITMSIIFGSNLCAVMILLVYIIRQKFLVRVLNRIMYLDKRLNVREHEMKHTVYYILFFVNLFIFTVIHFLMILQFPTLTSVLIRYVHSMTVFGVILQYSLILSMINKRFKVIQSRILNFKKVKRNMFGAEVLVSHQTVINNIDNLKSSYYALFEICQDVENFYGLPILFSILAIVVKAIFMVYFMISEIMGGLKGGIAMFYYGIFVLQHSFLLIILTSIVNKIIIQNEKTARIILLVVDKCTNQRTEDKWNKFSSDLLSLKIQITSCDLLPLDRTLLMLISGSISTYLIITIEF
ncbi:GSCOCT00013866001.3-RA-CDS [Cotesia congregata]|uniref:Gustatory receptor n=1 Tax=Cotesia congregata TaxID=51543 RepID=A0A8J2EFU7_COTCN|nr:GSCOCT00013866001.3-RA-CDS [Cotesia congregata]CAG5073963.1 gustatory receptor 47 [Cotesia congregata]